MDRAQERTDRIFLDPTIARCEPRLHCPMRSHCARYMASLPANGASVMDGTANPLWSPSGCGDYVPASQCVKPAPYKGPEKRRHWNDYGDSEW